MKRLFKFKYQKLTILILLIMLSYFIFSNKTADIFISNLGNLNYLGAFIAGLLFSFGFTTPFAIGYFITLNSNNIFILAIIGGFGALLSDLLIYKLIKMSFMSEFYELEKTKTFKELKHLFTHYTKHKIRIRGTTTDFKQEVESMQIDRKEIKEANSGDDIGIKVNEKVRRHDKIYKI